MLTVTLALVGAVVYGAADFAGGVAARRLPAVWVSTVSAAVGVVVFAALLAVVPSGWSADAVLWGGLSGLAGATAITLLYAALAIGPMSILSPVTAVISGLIPVVWSLSTGASLAPSVLLALGVILVAAALIAAGPGGGAVRPRAVGLVLAVTSGVGFGAFYILLDRAPEGSGAVPLLSNRAVSLVVLGAAAVVVALRRRPSVPDDADALRGRRLVAVVAAAAVLDTAANALLLAALRTGDLAIVAVLVSLYPAGTVALAAVVLRERIGRSQAVGVGLALAGSAILASV